MTQTLTLDGKDELADAWNTATELLVKGVYLKPGTDFAALAVAINAVTTAIRSLRLTLPPAYDFEGWVADLEAKSTPEAALLAEKVLTSLDSLMGAY